MTTTRMCALALLLQLATASVFAASPIRLTLTLDPPETIPGIEVSLRIDALNTSGSPAPMPVGMVLEVTPENGAPYLTSVGEGRQGRFSIELREADRSPVLIPGSGTRRFDVLAGQLAPWRYGAFWRTPGIYRLRVIADDGLTRSLNLTGDAFPLDSEYLVDPIASNSTVLTIVTPTGDDLAVWRMIAALDDWGWRDKIAAAVWQAYPNSSYTAYLVRKADGDTAKQIEFYAAALAKNPRGSYGDWYRVSMAGRYYGLRDGVVRDDLPRAFEYSEKARQLLEEVIRRNVDPGAVHEARQELENSGTSFEELKDYSERLRGAQRPFCERLVVKRVRDSVDAVVTDAATSDKTRKKLQDVLRQLDKFAMEVAKTPPSMDPALAALRAALMDLQAAIDDRLIESVRGTQWAGELVEACEISARKAIDASAKEANVNAKKLASARASLEEARALAAQSDWKGAASKFKEALNEAQTASKARAEGC